MLNFFRSIPIKSMTECIIRAFPLYLRNDVKLICKNLNFSEYFYHYDSTEWVLSSGEVITMPYRIVLKDEYRGDLRSLTKTQKAIYHCIMSRSSDGYVREKHIKALLNSDTPEWAMPYVIKVCDEYVVEILQTVYSSLITRDCTKYRQLCALNLEYIKRAHTRMVSYWNEFYRWDCYRYDNYIGKKLYRYCFGYGKTGQKAIKFE